MNYRGAAPVMAGQMSALAHELPYILLQISLLRKLFVHKCLLFVHESHKFVHNSLQMSALAHEFAGNRPKSPANLPN